MSLLTLHHSETPSRLTRAILSRFPRWSFPQELGGWRPLAHRVAAAVLVLGLSSIGAGQELPQDDRKVYLVYDEQHIADSDRAQLVRAISQAVPPESWRSVPVTRGSLSKGRVEQLVSKFYGLYRRGYPQTTETLIDIILAGAHEGTQPVYDLRMPPLPVSGNAFYNYEPKLRAFDPLGQAYALTSDLSEIPGAMKSDPSPVMKHDPRRRTNLTAIELPVSVLLKEIQRNPELRSLLARSVFPTTKDGFATLRLHTQAPAACGPNLDWLSRSPYRDLWENQRPKSGEQKFNELLTKAKNHPLYIVDWNTDPSRPGHGGKVLGAAKYLLHALKMDELEQYVLPIELNPAKNARKLKELLSSYKTYRESQGFGGEVLDAYFDKAKKWIDSPPPEPSDSTSFVVQEFVLQAIFWQYFGQSQSWLNMSFTINNASLDVLSPSVLIGSPSYGFLSAGNDPLELDLNSVPQAAASNYPNLVNVTYGDSDGGVFGSFSSVKYKTSVTVVAPGCGFSFAPLSLQDYGSSFASPYVAAATWLRYLLDETSIDEKSVKYKLILASRPCPVQARPIESGGIFDPALLLARPGPHYVDTQMRIVPILGMHLTISFQDGSRQSLSFSSIDGGPPTRALVLYHCQSDWCLWYRAVTLAPIPSLELRTQARVSNLAGQIQTAARGTVIFSNPDEFKAIITELWY